MLLTLVVALSLNAPPLQGSIRLQPPSAQGASAADVEAVQAALKQEFEAEGYAVLTNDAKPATAVVSGSVVKQGSGYLISLDISRVSDQRILEAVKQEAKSAADLPRAGIEAAKQLASSLRLSTGVRAKVKLK
ncbi:MAG: hypothetical protein ABTQ32_05735 [Myxococcaceae bacterium]